MIIRYRLYNKALPSDIYLYIYIFINRILLAHRKDSPKFLLRETELQEQV